jgi:hypothetical protein
MDYPYTSVTGANSEANTTSIIEVRVARDEHGVDAPALIELVKNFMAATSGVVTVTATSFAVTQVDA